MRTLLVFAIATLIAWPGAVRAEEKNDANQAPLGQESAGRPVAGRVSAGAASSGAGAGAAAMATTVKSSKSNSQDRTTVKSSKSNSSE